MHKLTVQKEKGKEYLFFTLPGTYSIEHRVLVQSADEPKHTISIWKTMTLCYKDSYYNADTKSYNFFMITASKALSLSIFTIRVEHSIPHLLQAAYENRLKGSAC